MNVRAHDRDGRLGLPSPVIVAVHDIASLSAGPGTRLDCGVMLRLELLQEVLPFWEKEADAHIHKELVDQRRSQWFVLPCTLALAPPRLVAGPLSVLRLSSGSERA